MVKLWYSWSVWMCTSDKLKMVGEFFLLMHTNLYKLQSFMGFVPVPRSGLSPWTQSRSAWCVWTCTLKPKLFPFSSLKTQLFHISLCISPNFSIFCLRTPKFLVHISCQKFCLWQFFHNQLPLLRVHVASPIRELAPSPCWANPGAAPGPWFWTQFIDCDEELFPMRLS